MTELIKLSLLFAVVFAIGYLLSAVLYAKQNKQFHRSTLQTKVLLWVPIFIIFVLFLRGPLWVRIAILIYIFFYIAKELFSALRQTRHALLIWLFCVCVCVGLLALPWLCGIDYDVVIAIGFASVLSDVFAFFMGNFFGKHHLPRSFNNRKSYEGVLGQFIGAAVGVLLINAFVVPTQLWLFLTIGAGSAFGDMANSYIKRKQGIKDWSSNLPGHGGFIDRFASLSFAILVTASFLLLIG